MYFLEKDLEQIIFETDNDLLYQRGLNVVGSKVRQLNIGRYGTADLVAFKRYQSMIIITVYELKLKDINVSAFLQAVGYVRGIQKYIDTKYPNWCVDYRIALVGKNLDLEGNFSFLPNIFPNVALYTYDYGFDGIVFKRHENYVLTNAGF